MINFPKRIKELRKQDGYTQAYVAKRLGIAQTSYGQYELGKARPEYEHLVALARLYDVSVDYLLENEDI
jgi:transcriptional regulator with XRE-family HTH domain